MLEQTGKFCTLCKENFVIAKGLCSGCYSYRYVNGKDRPVHLRNVSNGKGNCKNPHCQKPLRLGRATKGWCHLCYRYKWGYGIERPARLTRFIPDPENGYYKCNNPNCDKPVLDRTGRNRGYCRSCLEWRKKHDDDRPKQFCVQRVSLGWCECGNVATKMITIKYGPRAKSSQTLILCLHCCELEKPLTSERLFSGPR